jgi:para-nitrobenzyl esterase
MSEDCLFLNVWSPGTGDEKRPVVVWLHGGGFVMGSGSDPQFDGTSFAANHKIVVVTLNYRLGLLGFAYLNDLAGEDAHYSANCGLLDQIAALGWVHDNIAAFGGDPDRVTVMGESAGAMSIGALLAMPAAHGLFQRAILQSGAASNVSTCPKATRIASALLAKLRVKPSQLSSLADMPVENLLTVQSALGREFSERYHALGPVIDGATLPLHPLTLLKRGAAANVAILTGTCRDEWRGYAAMTGGPKVDEEKLGRLFSGDFQHALALYAAARADESPEWAWTDLVGDLMFRIPAIRLAEAQAQHGAPVWMYRFDWESLAFGGMLGASHSLEIPFVWNTLDAPGVRAITGDGPSTRRLAGLMHASWAAFIRSGKPTFVGLPVWPPYEPTRRATMVFGDLLQVVVDPQGWSRELWQQEI